MLTDSHCHLGSEAFADDRDEVLRRMTAEGVGRAIVIASTADEAERLATWLGTRPDAEPPMLWSTAGVHPHEADSADADALARVETLVREDPRVVAVGECGLDFHYDTAPRDVQRAALEAQIGIAERTGKPLVVHSRSAERDTIEVLASLPDGVRGVLHCFTGTRELLDAGLAAGWYVSFSGIVTFRSYEGGALVRAVPEDRILIETDSPYLTPVPFRGKRNEPARVVQVRDAVARMRGVSPARISEITSRNASALFGIPMASPAPSVAPAPSDPASDPHDGA